MKKDLQIVVPLEEVSDVVNKQSRRFMEEIFNIPNIKDICNYGIPEYSFTFILSDDLEDDHEIIGARRARCNIFIYNKIFKKFVNDLLKVADLTDTLFPPTKSKQKNVYFRSGSFIVVSIKNDDLVVLLGKVRHNAKKSLENMKVRHFLKKKDDPKSGGCTVVYTFNKRRIKYKLSVCSNKDLFNKKKGILTALQSPHVFEIFRDDDGPIIKKSVIDKVRQQILFLGDMKRTGASKSDKYNLSLLASKYIFNERQ